MIGGYKTDMAAVRLMLSTIDENALVEKHLGMVCVWGACGDVLTLSGGHGHGNAILLDQHVDATGWRTTATATQGK